MIETNKEHKEFFTKHNDKITIGNIGSGTKCSLEELYQAFMARLLDEIKLDDYVELVDVAGDDEE
jgi:hypothetical protein